MDTRSNFESEESSSDSTLSSSSLEVKATDDKDNEANERREIMRKMANFEFKEPGPVKDIEQSVIGQEELEEFLEKIKTLPTEAINLIFKDLSSKENINPNGNRFNSISKRALYRLQVKEHLENYHSD